MIALRHLLRRLRFNTSGNVLIITALCLVPLLMLIGSAVDISRATMARSRLQNACDAASLAARRVMRNDTFDDSVSNTGRQFFAFNFPQRSFDTEAFTPQITRPSAGVVRVTASTRIHNQIMNIFGFDTIALNVDCDASLNFVNTWSNRGSAIRRQPHVCLDLEVGCSPIRWRNGLSIGTGPKHRKENSRGAIYRLGRFA